MTPDSEPWFQIPSGPLARFVRWRTEADVIPATMTFDDGASLAILDTTLGTRGIADVAKLRPVTWAAEVIAAWGAP